MTGHPGRFGDATVEAGAQCLDASKLYQLKAYFAPQPFRDYVAACSEQIEKHVSMLIHAVETQDLPGVLWHAHDMKSLAGNIGAMALAETAKRMEAAAKAQHILPLQMLIGDLHLIKDSTLRALRETFCTE